MVACVVLLLPLLVIMVSADIKCHHRCETCYGPGFDECNSCVRNAYKDGSKCICLNGYSGLKCNDYVDDCADKCERCSGPTPRDCMSCIDNAYMNKYGDCVCRDGWGGMLCTKNLDLYSNRSGGSNRGQNNYNKQPNNNYYNGPANQSFNNPFNPYGGQSNYIPPNPYANNNYDPYAGGQGYDPYGGMGGYYGSYKGPCNEMCDGCTGPEPTDCRNCIHNAHHNLFGVCTCNSNYYGDTCDFFFIGTVFEKQCHPRCRGCIGMDLKDCIECIQNAHKDQYGYCMCDEGFYGSSCQPAKQMGYYDGPCDSFCIGCTGPEANQCIDCVHHAHKDDFGYCLCDDHYGGSDCSRFTGYKGKCDRKCAGECTGPTSSDCTECTTNSHWNSDGECICDLNYVGDDCSRYHYQGECDPKCRGCTGQTPSDCMECVDHAFWTSRGCTCELYWQGDDCSQQKYSGTCDPKCIGCIGPQANECLTCTANAELNQYGYCICDPYWSGDACDVYEKRCHPRCEVCHGPLASDCDSCVENSSRDDYGFCQCDNFWSGEDCGIYAGQCHSICDGCYGPEAHECEFCVTHAHRNEKSLCICDNNWNMDDCSNFVGQCDPLCKGCYGPSAKECEECAAHSHFEEHWCICDYYWGGNSCNTWKGTCNSRCDTCNGPEDNQCESCVENAYLDSNGTCVCAKDWDGIDCSIYTGTCHGICSSGCIGPTKQSCLSCVENAHRDEDGFCTCHSNWRMDDCTLFAGDCDGKCKGCIGPTDMDCETCTENANYYGSQRCECDPYWVKDDCSEWKGMCNTTCVGCNGPLETDCFECVNNARYDSVGRCVCEDHWYGVHCKTYSSPCDPKCIGCYGPSAHECDQCTLNSIRDENGSCVCNDQWSGKGCDMFAGQCDPRCRSGCTGPSNAECHECVQHAHKVGGRCICDENWDSTDGCAQWSGPCEKACNRCSGAGQHECFECRIHAVRATDGVCTCTPDWNDEQMCEHYQGQCSPLCKDHQCIGPELNECVACITNAHRSNSGECICKEYWSGSSCEFYMGRCDHRCIGCTGPTDADCVTCVKNAEVRQDRCQCQQGWRGSACRQYGNFCHAKCTDCIGPTDFDCTKCVENALRDSSGRCVCMEGWKGDNCSDEIIKCHNSCATCDGKSQNDCSSCYDGFTLIPGQFQGRICVSCDAECLTCDGIDTSDCLSCINGKALMKNSCRCCREDCKECFSAEERGKCTVCQSDSMLEEGGQCVCRYGVRSPITNKCVNSCPTGLTGSYCDQVQQDVHLDFGREGPWSSGKISADHCHPPKNKPGVSAYFEGNDSSIEVHGISPNPVFSIRLWTRIQNAGASLLSLKTNWLNVKQMYSGYERQCESSSHDQKSAQMMNLDLYMTSCSSLTLDVEGLHHEDSTNDSLYMDKWQEVIIQVKGNIGTEPLYRSHFAIEFVVMVNGSPIIQSTLKDWSVWADDQIELFIGSWMGKLHFLEGFVKSLTYSPSELQSEARGWQDNHWTNGEFDMAFTCELNEYFSSLCRSCDSTCHYGCLNSQSCDPECHGTCATCSSPSEHACQSCWCGAELQTTHFDKTKGFCTCQAGYSGKADDCDIGCPIGCEVCDDKHSNLCLYCSVGYELEDPNQVPGKCVPCQDERIYPDGSSLCEFKGPRRPMTECSCLIHEWFDGTFCRTCPAHCTDCRATDDHLSQICTACEDGYVFLDESDICMPQCGTGYEKHRERCEGNPEMLFSTNFAKDYDQSTEMWEYKIPKSMNVITLKQISSSSGSTPTVIDDRGAWFDGKEGILEFSSIVYHHSFSVDMWTKPHNDGDILIIDFDTQQANQRLVLAATEFFIQFSDLRFGNEFRPDHKLIEFYWTHIAVTIQWENQNHVSTIRLWHENESIAVFTDQHLMISMSQTPTRTNIGGAINNVNGIENAYRGFIYQIRLFNYQVTDFSDVISSSCRGDVQCELCPRPEDQCPGVCNWNHYWNGSRCQRCPLYCRAGCQRSGECQFSS